MNFQEESFERGASSGPQVEIGGLPISLHGQTVFWARGNRFYEIQKKTFTLSDFKAMEQVTRTSKVKAYEVIETPVPVNSLTMKTRSNSLPQR